MRDRHEAINKKLVSVFHWVQNENREYREPCFCKRTEWFWILFAKRVVLGVHLEQAMKLGYPNLAKKVSLTWISKLERKTIPTKPKIQVDSRTNRLCALGNLDWKKPELTQSLSVLKVSVRVRVNLSVRCAGRDRVQVSNQDLWKYG